MYILNIIVCYELVATFCVMVAAVHLQSAHAFSDTDDSLYLCCACAVVICVGHVWLNYYLIIM